ncbi:DUF3500 domain-containing protein [Akkermansiaceae bacterium]|jgi:hypothetical protein|nr:DUF3500 domain-containing protein [Akkermansiaceae bacterium]|tara:strand:- start:1235 stop:2245 length:1011 start_codon:yes stop_codon:yes gene_type:complete
MRFPTILATLTTAVFAHEGHNHNPAAAEMNEAATVFLASLDGAQRKAASFEFKNKERENWHFVPMDRKGVRFDALKPHQQHLAFGLLGTGLTQKGLMTATQIMTLEEILRSRGGDPKVRNTEKYNIAIFGSPSPTKPWGWRFEGHHLSLNFSLLGDKVIGLPAFYGTNPAELKKGPLKGMRPLGEIEDAGRQLAKDLIKADMSPVFSEKAPKEILTAQDSTAKAQQIMGTTSDKMNGEQVKQILAIVSQVASMQRGEITNESLRKINTMQRKKLHFAWGGSLERNGPHYFRIQGVDFIVEYANTQNDANHAHLVWRDLKDDFARDSLKKHYLENHK